MSSPRRGFSNGIGHDELAALADGSLPRERREELERRVAASPELAARLAEQRRAVALARGAARSVETPPALRARLERQPVRRATASRRRALVLVPAAAAVAVAVGAVVLGSHGSPERYRAALEPTGLAPGASGRATLTRTSSGWRVELDAAGLPRLAGRRYYEAWLRDEAGVLVPIGTFNSPRGVTLWSGVSPEDGATLTVTRELADSDQTSSGASVLAGTVDTDR